MNENYEEVAMEAVRRQSIVDGWKRFRFPGEPPRQGTPVEQRMIDTAAEYVEYAYSKQLRAKNVASKSLQDESESYQRVLHNQLAMMIYGENRSDMEYDKATGIKEFATSIAYPGFSVDQVYEMINNAKEE